MDDQPVIKPTESSDPSVPAPEVIQTPPPASKKKWVKPLIIIALILVLGGAVAAYFLFNSKEDQSDTNTAATSEVGTGDVAVDSPAIDTKGTYTLLPSSESVTFYDVKFGASNNLESASEDKSSYITFKIPTGWKVYESPLVPGVRYGGMYMLSPTGKYIHLNRVDGVGGYCEPNADSYKLEKKLSTATPGLFFTQYSYAEQDGEPVLRLEPFTNDGSRPEKHLNLKEGETNTDTCNLFTYSFALGLVYVIISDKDVFGLNSNIGWNDIKDDADFVKVLQSLTVVGS